MTSEELAREITETTLNAEVDELNERNARRAAEPPWLQRLRQRHSEVCRMVEEAHRALGQPHGRDRGEALQSLASGLRWLRGWLEHDIETAERDGGKQ
jgi:hypothetical protein